MCEPAADPSSASASNCVRTSERRPASAFRRGGQHADTAPVILMEPEVGYSLTHAKTALEDRGLDLGRQPARGCDRRGRPKRVAVRRRAEADRHSADDPRGPAGAGEHRAHRALPPRDRRERRRPPARAGGAGRPDPRHADRRGHEHRQRHRGRRDGGAPPRPRLPRETTARSVWSRGWPASRRGLSGASPGTGRRRSPGGCLRRRGSRAPRWPPGPCSHRTRTLLELRARV
jgi:hypothetical protein